jgi:hypothetical protein
MPMCTLASDSPASSVGIVHMPALGAMGWLVKLRISALSPRCPASGSRRVPWGSPPTARRSSSWRSSSSAHHRRRGDADSPNDDAKDNPDPETKADAKPKERKKAQQEQERRHHGWPHHASLLSTSSSTCIRFVNRSFNICAATDVYCPCFTNIFLLPCLHLF